MLCPKSDTVVTAIPHETAAPGRIISQGLFFRAVFGRRNAVDSARCAHHCALALRLGLSRAGNGHFDSAIGDSRNRQSDIHGVR